MSALLGNHLSRAFSFFEFYLANDAKGGEILYSKQLNCGGSFIIAADGNAGFLIAADEFIAAQRLKGEKDGITQGHKLLPFCFAYLPVDSRVNFGQHREVNGLDVLGFVRIRRAHRRLDCGPIRQAHGKPGFLGGVDEDGGEQESEGVEDFIKCGLAASARGAIGGVAIEAVFEQVHIDTAHIDAAEIVEQGEGAVIGEVVEFFGNASD